MASLLEVLGYSAERHARRALVAFLADDLGDFHLFAGLALEHAMKARLVRESPAFIAPDKSFKSMLGLVRAADDIAELPVGSLSIGAAESADRVRQLDPTFRDHVLGTKGLLGHRNGQAHLGASDSTNANDDLVTFLKAINALLRRDQDSFWDPHQDYVRAVLDENAAEVLRSVQRSLSEARERFADRTRHLNPGQAEAFGSRVEHDVDRGVADDVLKVDCPACESPALLSGENAPEHDVQDGDVWIEFTAHLLECDACGLELDGEEELEAAGIEASQVNGAVDFSTFMREYYAEDLNER
jgi:hypothetical protein